MPNLTNNSLFDNLYETTATPTIGATEPSIAPRESAAKPVGSDDLFENLYSGDVDTNAVDKSQVVITPSFKTLEPLPGTKSAISEFSKKPLLGVFSDTGDLTAAAVAETKRNMDAKSLFFKDISSRLSSQISQPVNPDKEIDSFPIRAWTSMRDEPQKKINMLRDAGYEVQVVPMNGKQYVIQRKVGDKEWGFIDSNKISLSDTGDLVDVGVEMGISTAVTGSLGKMPGVGGFLKATGIEGTAIAAKRAMMNMAERMGAFGKTNQEDATKKPFSSVIDSSVGAAYPETMGGEVVGRSIGKVINIVKGAEGLISPSDRQREIIRLFKDNDMDYALSDLNKIWERVEARMDYVSGYFSKEVYNKRENQVAEKLGNIIKTRNEYSALPIQDLIAVNNKSKEEILNQVSKPNITPDEGGEYIVNKVADEFERQDVAHSVMADAARQKFRAAGSRLSLDSAGMANELKEIFPNIKLPTGTQASDGYNLKLPDEKYDTISQLGGQVESLLTRVKELPNRLVNDPAAEFYPFEEIKKLHTQFYHLGQPDLANGKRSVNAAAAARASEVLFKYLRDPLVDGTPLSVIENTARGNNFPPGSEGVLTGVKEWREFADTYKGDMVWRQSKAIKPITNDLEYTSVLNRYALPDRYEAAKTLKSRMTDEQWQPIKAAFEAKLYREPDKITSFLQSYEGFPEQRKLFMDDSTFNAYKALGKGIDTMTKDPAVVLYNAQRYEYGTALKTLITDDNADNIQRTIKLAGKDSMLHSLFKQAAIDDIVGKPVLKKLESTYDTGDIGKEIAKKDAVLKVIFSPEEFKRIQEYQKIASLTSHRPDAAAAISGAGDIADAVRFTQLFDPNKRVAYIGAVVSLLTTPIQAKKLQTNKAFFYGSGKEARDITDIRQFSNAVSLLAADMKTQAEQTSTEDLNVSRDLINQQFPGVLEKHYQKSIKMPKAPMSQNKPMTDSQRMALPVNEALPPSI
jgi:hypothetical protein